jgi:hypothetical protein
MREIADIFLLKAEINKAKKTVDKFLELGIGAAPPDYDPSVEAYVAVDEDRSLINTSVPPLIPTPEKSKAAAVRNVDESIEVR